MSVHPTGARTIAFTCAALVGFAGNSLLCRLALGQRAVDAATFTSVRLCAGALTLTLLADRGRAPSPTGRGGSWTAAIALFAYAAAFSFAYLRLSAGTGALILFGAVQATMIGWALRAGDRPRPLVWVGFGVALCGLVTLTLPGLSSPDPEGAGLMVLAGIAWGAYSLLGRSAANALAVTAQNFRRSLPLAAAASLVTLGHAHASLRGVALAAVSGSVASGVGYSFWYAALRGLSRTRAAIAQLAVPPLAAAGGVVLLGETVTPRLWAAGALILAGVGAAVWGPPARNPGTS
jgi:drug/metabolite transporter (DMT)-like permease